MAWFLIIALYQGGVTSVPMPTHAACYSAAQLAETRIATGQGTAFCVPAGPRA